MIPYLTAERIKTSSCYIKSFPVSPGGTSLSREKLQDCINRATLRQQEIQKLIVKVLKSVKPSQ